MSPSAPTDRPASCDSLVTLAANCDCVTAHPVFSDMLHAASFARAGQSIFGLTILLGAYEMSSLAGLVFLIMPCVIVGWLAFGPLPCDKDETMRRMKFG